MTVLEILFWLALAVVVYTYVGYGLVVWVWLRIRRWVSPSTLRAEGSLFEPAVTLVIAAYNEIDCIVQKAQNALTLDYPKHKLRVLFVTDGSTDGTPEHLANIVGVEVMHEPKRQGKIAAIHRAMQQIDSPIVIFSDANTMLNREAIRNIVQHYRNPHIGAVAGEKRVMASNDTGASEGLYWRYESFLKQQDAELYSVVGAAGELFSIRRALYEPVASDTILDDFMLSLTIAEKGYRIAYAADAYATEPPSASITDEMKRKVRISAGGFQSMVRLTGLLNVCKHRMLAFQYVSHRVLRWTLAPLCLPLLFIWNTVLTLGGHPLYLSLFVGQVLFYSIALVGISARHASAGWRIVRVFAYFCLMNIAVYQGFVRHVRNQQSVLWERAARQALDPQVR